LADADGESQPTATLFCCPNRLKRLGKRNWYLEYWEFFGAVRRQTKNSGHTTSPNRLFGNDENILLGWHGNGESQLQ
jgi:hypothetical protein